MTTPTHTVWQLGPEGTWSPAIPPEQASTEAAMRRVAGSLRSVAARAGVDSRYEVAPVDAPPAAVPLDQLPKPQEPGRPQRHIDAERPSDRAFSDAREVIAWLGAHPDQWVPYGPADQPAMLISMVQRDPHPSMVGYNHSELMLIVSDAEGSHQVFTEATVTTWCSDEAAQAARAAARGNYWTPETWVRAYGGTRHAPRYAFVRPLLAALGWAPGGTDYDPRDADRVRLVAADVGALSRRSAGLRR